MCSSDGVDNAFYVYGSQAFKYEKCIISLSGDLEALAGRIAGLPDHDRDTVLRIIAGFENSGVWTGSPRASLLQSHRGDPAFAGGSKYPGISPDDRTLETKAADQL